VIGCGGRHHVAGSGSRIDEAGCIPAACSGPGQHTAEHCTGAAAGLAAAPAADAVARLVVAGIVFVACSAAVDGNIAASLEALAEAGDTLACRWMER